MKCEKKEKHGMLVRMVNEPVKNFNDSDVTTQKNFNDSDAEFVDYTVHMVNEPSRNFNEIHADSVPTAKNKSFTNYHNLLCKLNK